MALANYDELKAAVARWMHRIDLTDQIPDFIALAESYLNRELRLRVMQKEVALTVAAGDRAVALPSDFISPMDLWVEARRARATLRYREPNQMIVDAAPGEAAGWTITGGNIELDRTSVGPICLTLRYYSALRLTESNPTNWLLDHHPDIYLFGALTEAAPFTRDEGASSAWMARRDRAIDEINTKESRIGAMATLDTRSAVMPSQRHTGGYGGIG